MHFKQRETVRHILSSDQSSIAACWFSGFLASGYSLRSEEAGQTEPDTVYLDEADQEAFLVTIERATEMQLADMTRAKILAGMAVTLTDVPYTQLPAFIDFANLTNAADPPLPNVFNPADVTECGCALVEVGMIVTDLSAASASRIGDLFSLEIRSYWGAVLSGEGCALPKRPFTQAVMPNVDPMSDPMLFEAMADQTDTFANDLASALWRYAVKSFDAIAPLTDKSGQSVVTANQMREFMTALVGRPS